ncbi:MAG: hypothetical protein LN566_00200 [Rickettsia endosymbiont of Stiretrus anchorago]|nr:hypothetical protein [Rickettsia endosymbiont of Stiretrus anchorago]
MYQDLVVLLKEREVNEEAIKITELIQDFPKNLSDLVSYIDENISPSLLTLI